MKKIILLMLAMILLSVSPTAAEDFMPRKLEISCDNFYRRFRPGFDNISVTVTGGDATVFFAVFSKDNYDRIDNLQINQLSWRTVNKIDTCIYISHPYHLTEGSHDLDWDGRISEDAPLPPGDYYFYLWGIETETSVQLVSRDIPLSSGGGIIQTHDYQGNPVEHPLFYPAVDIYSTGIDSVLITHSRWTIGSDPLDASAIEQTWYRGAPNWAERGPLAISQYDCDGFYVTGYNLQVNKGIMRRFRWVTGGESFWDKMWGDDGEVRFQSIYPEVLVRDPGAVFIGEDVLLGTAYARGDDLLFSQLPKIDAIEGYIIETIESQPWWQPIPNQEPVFLIESIKNNRVHGRPSIVIGNHMDCLFHLLNPQDADRDWLRYAAATPNQQRAYGIPSIDDDGFALLPSIDASGSVGILAPDGAWMGMLALTGEIQSRNMMIPVNYDSPYDGLYFDAQINESTEGLYFRGYDSLRGILSIDFNYRPFQITTPNGGEIIPSGSTHTIRALHSLFPNTEVFLKYSIDNGFSWTLIDSVLASNAISYDWRVPNVSSDECLIRMEWEGYILIKPVSGNDNNQLNTPMWIEYDQSDSTFTITKSVDVNESPPDAFTVFPASPNPFNPSTTIEFILPEESHVRVTIFNALGQRVERLHDGFLGAGRHRLVWDAGDMGPGLYFYRVETDAATKTGKMMLVK